MKFCPGLATTSPSTASQWENQAAHKWVNDVMVSFEKKEADYVDKWFEDSDEAKLVLEGRPPVMGRRALKNAYEWMFKTDDDVEWILKSAIPIGHQVIFSLEAAAASKGEKATRVQLHLIAEKSPVMGQEHRIRSLTMYGDTKAFLNEFEAGSGPIPDFYAVEGQ